MVVAEEGLSFGVGFFDHGRHGATRKFLGWKIPPLRGYVIVWGRGFVLGLRYFVLPWFFHGMVSSSLLHGSNGGCEWSSLVNGALRNLERARVFCGSAL